MTFSTLASPGVSLQGGGGSGGGGGGTPGGSDTQLQYNSSGSFAGASGITTNGTNLTLSSSSQLLWSTDLILTRKAAANLRLGAADAAAPVAQTLSVQSVVAGTTNTAGANLTITGSQGTGTGAGGSIVFQVAPAGSSGTAQNALATALTIDGTGTNATFAQRASFGASTVFIERESSVRMQVSVGSNPFAFTNSGFSVGSSAFIGFRATQDITAAVDTYLYRDNTGILALRNGANAQVLRVYNTTDGTNSEFCKIAWSSNVLQIGTEKAGTGTARALEFQTDGTSRWSVGATTGHMLASADNTYDIGASTGSRPRNVYVAGSVRFPSGDGIVQIRYINNTSDGFTAFELPAGGSGHITFALATTAPLFRFCGTTSSFPALKRNSTALETKLADDSAYAPHAMQYLDVTDGITAPASATGRARIYVDTADGDLKVIFADGTVKTIVTDT